MKIQNRTFIISGGASGLGKGSALELIQAGGHVAVLDISDPEAGQAVEKELGPAAKFFHCNVLDTESIAKAVQGAVDWASKTGKPLGGVIPAAGVNLPAAILNSKGKTVNLDDVDFVLGVNIRGTIDLIRQSAVHLAKVEPEGPDGERGVVILVSSSSAFDGQYGQVVYGASKGAVASMALPMARDLARYGIRVVAIAPNLFVTGMSSVMSEKSWKSISQTFLFPNRAGNPPEFSMLVKHIIENPMLNGAVIRLDGGSRLAKI
ncbi:NAD(P)-binding protein [Trichoderma citrinoviride]|uniref:NAD(P)-binding protein n=1 Tax=Trichoderma citrinoviride TaxID=58853 RepID=A0A2T4B9K7_9HYPO|nr:NAD(P)-binding protein [Trichoderma citrinoviride]PTB66013.1 NAD(P)-binding protein [Trichoderma citrinoviride]